MEKETKSQIIFLFVNLIFSFALTNLGILVYDENKAIGLISILIAITLIFLSFYVIRIKQNQKDIEEINKKIKTINEKLDLNWQILNTLKDNKLLGNINKLLKNE